MARGSSSMGSPTSLWPASSCGGATTRPRRLSGVDSKGTRFKTALASAGNFTFWFDLKDTEGFQNREAVKYDVRGFRDEAPRVMIDEPKSDRDVPADATVPVKLTVDDDFGIHSSRLIYRLATGDSEPHAEVAIPLWTPPREKQPGSSDSGFIKHEEIAHTWELAPLKLPVGTIITFYADARDFDSLKGPNIGQEPRNSPADRLEGRRGPPV